MEYRYGAGWTWHHEVASDYDKVPHFDTHGALVDVYDGQGRNMIHSGRYTRDGRGRVTAFRDPRGDVYDYVYDGAGRLTEVGRTAPGRARTWWDQYGYDGPYPTWMWESGVKTPVVRWTYDALGRTLTKRVLDRQTNQYDQYAWTWDQQWIGKQDEVDDPEGREIYKYELGARWGLGHLTNLTRTWSGAGAASFTYTTDRDGANLTTTWPSGVVERTTYSASRKKVRDVTVQHAPS